MTAMIWVDSTFPQRKNMINVSIRENIGSGGNKEEHYLTQLFSGNKVQSKNDIDIS